MWELPGNFDILFFRLGVIIVKFICFRIQLYGIGYKDNYIPDSNID